MKNILLLFTCLFGILGAGAQNIMPENDFASPQNNGHSPLKCAALDNLLSRLYLDVNILGGKLTKQQTTIDPTLNYVNSLNAKISGVKFSNGISGGIDAELSYYFDVSGRYGLGLGVMYLHQSGDLTMNNFHIEYQSVDKFNNTFRQTVTATGPVKERLGTTGISIPVLFKYKLKLSEGIFFNADAGLLINLIESSHYATNASFDYGAIYKYSGTQGNLVPVYDYSATPAPGDLLLTRSQYLSGHSADGVQQYFNGYQSQGYNVAADARPGTNHGRVSAKSGSVGILLRPSVSIAVSNAIFIHAGVYYQYQNFRHDAPSDYRLTNKVGEYNALVNSINHSVDNSFGISIGASYRLSNNVHTPLMRSAEDTSAAPIDENDTEENEGSTSSGDRNEPKNHQEHTTLHQMANRKLKL
jgi:hypothetical protein